MDRERKNNAISVRLEPQLRERAAAVEKATGINTADLIRQSLEAVIRSFELNGKIDFPIYVVGSEGMLSAVAQTFVEKEGEKMRGRIEELLYARMEEEWRKHTGLFPPKEGDGGNYVIEVDDWVSAGGPEKEDRISIDCIVTEKNYPENYRAFQVSGQSMYPEIVDSEVVIVRPNHEMADPVSGSRVIFRDDAGRLSLHQFIIDANGVRSLRPYNPVFPEIKPIAAGLIDAVVVDVLPLPEGQKVMTEAEFRAIHGWPPGHPDAPKPT
ncbi:S24 family peptidase [Luteolibacter soli]|uniref:S24 family peptidase n=1 Tax=Luteolibacter soli TaxID=3135280 RepID=A0ABU9AYF9_9BACT